MRRGIDLLARTGNWIAVLTTLAILLVNTTEVLLRRFTGRGLGGTIEVSEVLLVIAVYLAMSYAQLSGAHVSTSVVTGRLPPRVRAALRTVGLSVAALVFLWMAWETGKRGWQSFQRGETRMGLRAVPIWPARLIIPVGLTLLAAQIFLTISDQVRILRGQPPLHADTPPAGPAVRPSL